MSMFAIILITISDVVAVKRHLPVLAGRADLLIFVRKEHWHSQIGNILHTIFKEG